jgi:hypothetical protein
MSVFLPMTFASSSPLTVRYLRRELAGMAAYPQANEEPGQQTGLSDS